MKRIIFISYALFILSLTIFSYAFVDPNLFYLKKIYTGFAFNNKFLTAAIYASLVILFFIFYFLFLNLSRKKELSLKNIKILILMGILLLFSYPAMLSYDIFNYFSTSKVLYFYHENPYLIMPIEFTGDPFLLFTRSANKIALYGHSWIALTAIPFLTGLGNFFLIIFNFKLFIFLFFLGTIFLIWRLTKNLFSVSLFALNPLILIETLISGHNDIVMIFLVLLSLYGFWTSQNDKKFNSKQIFLSLIFFTLSVFIKYATLFLIPVFMYLLWKSYIKEKIPWDKIYLASSLLMFLAFLLSPIREEIYPWYAIWFLTFSFLVPKKRFLLIISLAFSFSLLLRYIPYMFSGTYLGQTPIIKTMITFVPPVLSGAYYVIKKKI